MRTTVLALLTTLTTIFSLQALAQTPAIAKIHFDSGDLTRAKEAIDKSIEDPRHNTKPKTWYYRGLIYEKLAAKSNAERQPSTLGLLQQAHEAYKKALTVAPDDKTMLRDTERSLNDLHDLAMNYGVQCYQASNKSHALQAFVLAAAVKPGDLLALSFASELALDLQEYPQYEQLAAQLTALPMAAYEAHNATREAAAHLLKQDVYGRLALYWSKQRKNAAKAIETCKKGLAELPGNQTLHSLLTSIYLQNKMTTEALASAQLLTKQRPGEAWTFFNLGTVHEQLQQTDAALQAYQKAFQLDSNSTDVLYNLGALHYNRAAEISKKLSGMSTEEYNKNVAAEEKRVKAAFEAALPYFEMLQRRQPDNILALMPLSVIYGYTGQKDKADKVNAAIKRLQ